MADAEREHGICLGRPDGSALQRRQARHAGRISGGARNGSETSDVEDDVTCHGGQRLAIFPVGDKLQEVNLWGAICPASRSAVQMLLDEAAALAACFFSSASLRQARRM